MLLYHRYGGFLAKVRHNDVLSRKQPVTFALVVYDILAVFLHEIKIVCAGSYAVELDAPSGNNIIYRHLERCLGAVHVHRVVAGRQPVDIQRHALLKRHYGLGTIWPCRPLRGYLYHESIPVPFLRHLVDFRAAVREVTVNDRVDFRRERLEGYYVNAAHRRDAVCETVLAAIFYVAIIIENYRLVVFRELHNVAR